MMGAGLGAGPVHRMGRDSCRASRHAAGLPGACHGTRMLTKDNPERDESMGLTRYTTSAQDRLGCNAGLQAGIGVYGSSCCCCRRRRQGRGSVRRLGARQGSGLGLAEGIGNTE